ncbi:hypothetical protein AAU57_06870 [Nonlabens sp. YIK11]|uniref:hypothetical protein n=1 Tax=Nonlabens sp. YIK11 TaxID=1453349 RepID=UPI0006DC0D98|nr:hypothetical protein [Nonlabens sp. YIK11]KQC33068.1 hypothetical protein AAU57_06870 [Nonlabens sp. YIK11]
MKNAILLLFLFIISQLPAQNTPEALVETFFKEQASKGPEVALTNLYSNNEWAIDNAESISILKKKLVTAENVLGKMHGHALLGEKKLNDYFVIYTYTALYDLQPMRFTFQFYKPKDRWKTFAFSFDENLDDELEASLKLAPLADQ